MSTTRHTIAACRSGSYNGMDFDNEYVITFSFLPGSPDTYDASRGGPGGWDPGYGPEIEFVSIEPDAGDHGGFLIDWAKNWLDEHAAECAEIAAAAREPDPDAARDARIDDGDDR